MNLCFDQTFNRKNANILLDKVFNLNLAIGQYTLKFKITSFYRSC